MVNRQVERFFEEIGVTIEYPKTTEKRTNQRGTITRQRRDNNGTINFIDSKWLRDKAEQTQDKDKTKARRTKEPNPNPLKNTSDFFEKLWSVYPKKDGRKAAERHYHASIKNDSDMERINLALGNYLTHIEMNSIDPKFVKNGSTWFNNWQDWEIEHGK